MFRETARCAVFIQNKEKIPRADAMQRDVASIGNRQMVRVASRCGHKTKPPGAWPGGLLNLVTRWLPA